MNTLGPVIVIEDDEDDQFILTEVFSALNYSNEIIFFSDGEKALEFLIHGDKKPFLILSDINLPKINGLELRNKLRTDVAIHLKCIPYLLFTTSSDHRAVIYAYSASVQGFFTKPSSYVELMEQMKIIMEYWKHCSAPNNFIP